MNIRKEKGITTLSLIITIFMLAIVSATIIYYSRSLSKTAKIENLKSNMILIQAQAKIISEKYNYDNGSVTLIGTPYREGFYTLSEENLREMGLEEIAKTIDNKKEKYYVRYAIDIGEEKHKDDYIQVKYEPGITYEGKLYTLLSEIESDL